MIEGIKRSIIHESWMIGFGGNLRAPSSIKTSTPNPRKLCLSRHQNRHQNCACLDINLWLSRHQNRHQAVLVSISKSTSNCACLDIKIESGRTFPVMAVAAINHIQTTIIHSFKQPIIHDLGMMGSANLEYG